MEVSGCPLAAILEQLAYRVGAPVAPVVGSLGEPPVLRFSEAFVCAACDLLLRSPICSSCGAEARRLRRHGIEGRRLDDLPDLLTEEELAHWLGVERVTLQSWRYEGLVPEYVRIGRISQGPVRYDAAAIRAFIESRRRRLDID